MKLVLNFKFGGFGLSQEAMKMLVERGWSVTTFREDHYPVDRESDLIFKDVNSKFGYAQEGYNINWFYHDDSAVEFRSHNDIIEVVELLGKRANGYHSSLGIVEIDIDEDDYVEVGSYDGYEHLMINGRKYSF